MFNVNRRGMGKKVRKARQCAAANSRRRRFENLEDRRVLAAVVWDGGAGTLNWNDAANWNNNVLPGANDSVTINIAGVDATIQLAGPAAVIGSLNSQEGIAIDLGTSLLLTSDAASVIEGQLTNSGELHLQTGFFALNGGGTSTGAMTVDAGATLALQGQFHQGHRDWTISGDVQGAGTFILVGDISADVTGPYHVTGATVLNSLLAVSTLNFTDVQSVGADLYVSADQAGATINLHQNGAPAPLNVSKLTLNRASVTSGQIDATNFIWNSGVLKGTGAVNVTGNLQLSGPGALGDLTLDGRTLNNLGASAWESFGNNGNIHLVNGAVFSNAGSLHIKNLSGHGHHLDGDGSFHNGGTLIKTLGVDNDHGPAFEVPFSNAGTVHVQSGVIFLDGGGSSTGTFTVDAGATLVFDGHFHQGHRDWSIGGTVLGSGSLRFVGDISAEVPGLYNVTGTTFLGSLQATNSLNFTNVQRVGTELFVSADQNGATATFFQNGAPAALTMSKLTMNRASVTAGQIDATEFIWHSGVLKGAGDVNVTGDLRLSSLGSSGDLTLDGRTLNSSGSAVWQTGIAGNGNIHLIHGAVLNNTGSMDIKNLFTNGRRMDGDGAFNNAGSLVKTTGANDAGALIDVPFFNTGDLRVQAGVIIINDGGSSSGAITVDEDQVLRFESVGYTQTAGVTTLRNRSEIRTPHPLTVLGGQLIGEGTVVGTLINGGTVSPGLAPESTSRLTVNGAYVQTSTGALSIEIGGTSDGTVPGSVRQYDQLRVLGAVTLDGDVEASLVNGFVPAVNDTFKIIDHVATGPVIGQFQQETVTTGDSEFAVSYTGGDGNDVTLTALETALAPLTVTVNNSAWQIGTPFPQFTVSYLGFLPGDDPSVLDGALVFSTVADVNSGVGTYAVSASGLTSDDYEITFIDGALTVTPAVVYVDWRPESLNIDQNGAISLVIFGTSAFNVTQVSIGSLQVADVAIDVFNQSLSDANNDGQTDLTIHFQTSDALKAALTALYADLLVEDYADDQLYATKQDTLLTLDGAFGEFGQEFHGTDSTTIFLAGNSLKTLLASLGI